MKKSSVWPILIGLLILIAIGALWFLGIMPRSLGKGAPYETKLFEGKKVIFRVTGYHEKVSGLALPGAFIVFEARARASGSWSPLFESAHDDPRPIPEVQTGFVTDDLAYLFTGARFAVTADSGHTWFLWDASKDLPAYGGDAGAYFAPIRQVTLSSDGTGTMLLQHPGDDPRKSTLRTIDFGRHWTP